MLQYNPEALTYSVGLKVGYSVGLSVGVSVGDSVGLSVGEDVGALDGIFVCGHLHNTQTTFELMNIAVQVTFGQNTYWTCSGFLCGT